MKKLVILLIVAFAAITATSQTDLSKVSLSGMTFRSIGPALTSGRVIDIAVNPDNPAEFYVAAASGGVWKTSNGGTTFTPVFDSQGSYSIGCVTLDPNNHNVVWVGTGENNNQRSVGYGDGVYRSLDGGKTWKNMGLKSSEHIGMIKVHPENSDIVYVAAYGPLWKAGGDRGLYKTTDGGKTWERILYIDQYTGINEVHLDPRDPGTIYATAHQRMRHVFTYVGGGPGSAIYKSTDGGNSFRKLTNGLPKSYMGRIGMAIAPSSPDILYAIIEAENDEGGFFRSLDRGESWTKMNKYKTSGNYYQELYVDPINPDKVFMMDTYCHFTLDGGGSIKKLPEKDKHVDNHCMWIDPDDTDHYLMGCDGGLYETFDDAQHWDYFPNLPITQFYRVTVDNDKPFYNVFGGTQDNFSLGGPSRTRKLSGIDNYDWYVTNEGDGFESQIDPVNPNIIYAQAQYGWLVRYDKATGETVPIQPQPGKDEPAYRWNWDAPLLISPHNHKRLFFAANKVFKSDDMGNSWEAISPDLTRQIDRNKLKVMGQVQSVDVVMKNMSTTIYGNIVSLSESPLKEGLIYVGTDDGLIQVTEDMGQNWRKIAAVKGVPERTYVNDIKASLHDENVVYAAFNNHKNGDFKPYLFKSTDKGKTWTPITNGLPDRGSVYSIAEDHVNKDLLFAGTEFGVFFTVDGGQNWKQLKAGLPTIAIRDIDIQREQNDLILASFGRGFYILDDYSPLREINSETIDKDAYIFNGRNGLVFIPDSKYGYQGSGFQGAAFWTAKNPPLGVVITYYLKEKPLTLKEERQQKEKDARKNGSDVEYPEKNRLRQEAFEEKPYLLFVIKDSEGSEIRRLTKPASAGVNRIVWDGKLADVASTKTKNEPLTKSGAANLALPGDYSVSMYMSKNGQVKLLVADHPVKLEVLNKSTLPVDQKAVFAFQQSIVKLRRVAYGVEQYRNYLQKRVKLAKANARNTPGISIETLDKLRKLEEKLHEVDIALNGDRVLAQHQFETKPGILGRIGLAVWSSWNYQGNPTQIQKNDIAIAGEELKTVIGTMKDINEQLESIEQTLENQGAPFREVVLPEWN